MPKPLLPPLREDGNNQVSVFSTHGEWDRRPSVALAQVAKSLRLENVDGAETQIASIPSMWARPLLFEMALFDHEHLLHRRIVGEWRGLLALLALRLTKGINDVEGVMVTVPENAELEAVRALHGTTPTHTTIATHTGWQSLYVIQRRGVAIGMTSPTTLVCTAEEYADVDNPRLRGREVAWCLTDPCETLNGPERTQLLSWLDAVRGQLVHDQAIDHNAPRWNDLLRAFEDYISDVGRPRDAKGAVEVDPGQQWETGGLDMSIGMYRYVDRCAAPPEEDPGRSAVRVVPTDGREDATPLLLVDPEMAAQWDMSPEDVHVIAGLHLGMLNGPNVINSNQFAGRLLNKCLVMSAQDLFVDSITVLLAPEGLPGVMAPTGSDQVTLGDGVVTPLLPVTSTLLKYLTATDLADRVTFKMQANKIVVSLRLTLAGPNGQNKDYRITKSYNKRHTLQRGEPPVLEVWPNFETADQTWRRYYSFFKRTDPDNQFYARPYAAENVLDRHVERDPRGRNEVTVEILSLSSFPEAMECELSVPNAVGDGFETKNAGLLLLKRPNSIAPTAARMRIGIDFGTSGTTVYTRHGENLPERMVLQNLLHQVSNASNRRLDLYNYFLSYKQETMPLQSLFMAQVFTKQVPQSIRPFIDGHIVYNADETNVENNSRVTTNLKWGGQDERTKTQGFLAELTLQAAAMAASQGVREVSWRYAYPTQFSDAERIAFKTIWRDLCRQTAKDTGVRTVDAEPRQHTESVASARFLANLPDVTQAPPFKRGVVCLDIGGGTSDLSVWQGTDEALKFQTSLKFAGRDIFCEQLVQQKDVLAAFDEEWDPFGDVREPTANYGAIENVLRNKHDKLMKALPHKFDTNDAVARFIQAVGLGVVGLFYYVGLVLRSLVNAERYQPQLPDIYVVGNGAQILHWLSIGTYEKDCPMERLLKKAVCEASELSQPERFRIRVSPLPKSEVAYGLVSDDWLEATELPESEKAPVAGEDFQSGGGSHAWHERLTAAQLSNGVTIGPLTSFTKCLQFYQDHAREGALKPFVVDNEQLGVAKEHLDVKLGTEAGRDVQDIRVNPPFIMALQRYLQLYPWDRDEGTPSE